MRNDLARMHNEYLDPDRYNVSSESGTAEFDIDLKWSLWSADEGTWEERAPEAIKHMRLMLDNTLVIKTAPKKEIRYGTVTITGTSDVVASGATEAELGELQAEGRFVAGWDEPRDLLDTFGLPDTPEDLDCLIDCLPYTGDGDPGVYVEFSVKATSVAELLRLVDQEENKLIKESEERWKELEELFKKEE